MFESCTSGLWWSALRRDMNSHGLHVLVCIFIIFFWGGVGFLLPQDCFELKFCHTVLSIHIVWYFFYTLLKAQPCVGVAEKLFLHMHVTNVSSFLRLLFSYYEKVHIKHPASVSNGYAVTWKQKLPPKRGKLLFFLKNKICFAGGKGSSGKMENMLASAASTERRFLFRRQTG